MEVRRMMVAARLLAMTACLTRPTSAFLPLVVRTTPHEAIRSLLGHEGNMQGSKIADLGHCGRRSLSTLTFKPQHANRIGFHSKFSVHGRKSLSLASMREGSDEESTLQKRLWEEFDVLPDYDESPVRLEKTQDTGTCDLGLVAKTDIEVGDVLVSVPIRYSLSVNLVSRKDELSSDFRLAIFLLQVLGRIPWDQPDEELSKRWKDYVETLLPAEAGAAVLWDEEEVEEVQFEKSVEDIKALKGRLDDQCKRYLEEGGEAQEEDLRWALGVIRSRSFRLVLGESSAERQLRSLVPVADLFNHRPESPATWAQAERESTEDIPDDPWQVIEGDDGELYVDIVADKAFAAGEEVLLPYGLETGSELLTSHGLVLPDNEAEYLPLYMDAVELVGDVVENELQQDTAAARAKLQILQKQDAAEAPLAIRPGGDAASGHLLGCLQVAYAETSELAAFSELFDPAVGHFVLKPTVGEGEGHMSAARAEELEGMARQKAGALCGEELERMPTTVEEDKTLLEGNDASRRLRTAVEYRIQVKEMLQAFRDTNA